MRRPHIRASEWHSRGLGWELVTAQPDIIQHGGDNPGFRAFAAASVGSRYGMVAMTNGNNGGAYTADVSVTDGAINAIVSPRTATSARYHGLPVPSTIRPLRMTRSYGWDCARTSR